MNLFTGIISDLQGAVDVIAATGEYFVSEQEIAELRDTLSGLISDLESDPMSTTAGRVFGESWGGGYLAHHTSIAERHLRDNELDVLEGLNDFRGAVVSAERLAVETDGGVADRLRALADAPLIVDTSRMDDGASCLSQPDLTDNETCRA